MKSRRESKGRNLRDLDFLALVLGLGLLTLLFRRIERWLHQHIFKVGWLLTGDFQVTALLYYILFLPGILLHELGLWLAARALNVRTEGALRIPDEADISELRLSIIRVAPDAGGVKLILISLSPLASGLAALWAISAILIPGDAATLALPGSVTELGAAIRSLTTTANFWLWLYIVFTIANRCFPALPVKLSARRKSWLTLAWLALCFSLWRVADSASPAIALGLEGLLGRLTLIIAQITILNLGCVLALGALEALIERIGSRSATFRAGRMITLLGDAAASEPAGQTRERQDTAKAAAARQAAPAKSIYDLKLPIPGPPGREPVSRQAVAVVDSGRPASADDQKLAAQSKPAPTVSRRHDDEAERTREQPNLISDEAVDDSGQDAAEHVAVAPFARPFREQDAPASAPEDEATDAGADDLFARPFVMSSRSGPLSSADESNDLELDSADIGDSGFDADNTLIDAETAREEPRRGPRRPRPAPKPSQRVESETGGSESLATDELVYEDLDEADAVDPDDGRYDEL